MPASLQLLDSTSSYHVGDIDLWQDLIRISGRWYCPDFGVTSGSWKLDLLANLMTLYSDAGDEVAEVGGLVLYPFRVLSPIDVGDAGWGTNSSGGRAPPNFVWRCVSVSY
jgi:hypothetical protein